MLGARNSFRENRTIFHGVMSVSVRPLLGDLVILAKSLWCRGRVFGTLGDLLTDFPTCYHGVLSGVGQRGSRARIASRNREDPMQTHEVTEGQRWGRSTDVIENCGMHRRGIETHIGSTERSHLCGENEPKIVTIGRELAKWRWGARLDRVTGRLYGLRDSQTRYCNAHGGYGFVSLRGRKPMSERKNRWRIGRLVDR